MNYDSWDNWSLNYGRSNVKLNYLKSNKVNNNDFFAISCKVNIFFSNQLFIIKGVCSVHVRLLYCLINSTSLLWMLTFLFYFYNLEIIVSRKRLGNQNITIVSERIK